jgi:ATP:cob(I)alamin adenosyltransferase
MVALIDEGEAVNEIGLVYINRLSDYFFVIACVVNLKLKVEETVYKRSPKVFRTKK